MFAQTHGWVDLSLNLPGAAILSDVQFIGDEGWIAEHRFDGSSRIYYTPDGGVSFSAHSIPAGSGLVQSLFMRSATEGYAVTGGNSNHKVLHTTDARNGGWHVITNAPVSLYSVTFPPAPAATGYACGGSGRVYAITGETMTESALTYPVGDTFTGISFPVSADEGWVIGGTTIRH